MSRPIRCPRAPLGWLASILLLASPARAIEQFNAYLVPDTSRVEPHAIVPVQFTVDSTAHEFNGYQVTIWFDRRIVSFDSVEQGSLMTEYCPNQFTYLTTTDSTATYTDVILCNGVSLNGPGVLSTFKFRADTLGTTPIAITSDPDRTFYDAGLYVAPTNPNYPRQVVFHNAAIVVRDVNSGVRSSDSSSGLAVRLSPNPVRSWGEIRLEVPEAGPVSVEIMNPAGGRVWRWDGHAARTGEISLPWPDHDRGGRPLPSGAYLCRATSGSRVALARAIVCR